MLDMFLESQRRVIPAPKLKWDDESLNRSVIQEANMFGFLFEITLQPHTKYWQARVMGAYEGAGRKIGSFSPPNAKQKAMDACQSYWESIWAKEVGVPAADPKILEEAIQEVFRIVHGVYVHGDKQDRLHFALAYITEQLDKYRSGGKQNP